MTGRVAEGGVPRAGLVTDMVAEGGVLARRDRRASPGTSFNRYIALRSREEAVASQGAVREVGEEGTRMRDRGSRTDLATAGRANP